MGTGVGTCVGAYDGPGVGTEVGGYVIISPGEGAGVVQPIPKNAHIA